MNPHPSILLHFVTLHASQLFFAIVYSVNRQSVTSPLQLFRVTSTTNYHCGMARAGEKNGICPLLRLACFAYNNQGWPEKAKSIPNLVFGYEDTCIMLAFPHDKHPSRASGVSIFPRAPDFEADYLGQFLQQSPGHLLSNPAAAGSAVRQGIWQCHKAPEQHLIPQAH